MHPVTEPSYRAWMIEPRPLSETPQSSAHPFADPLNFLGCGRDERVALPHAVLYGGRIEGLCITRQLLGRGDLVVHSIRHLLPAAATSGAALPSWCSEH